MSFISMLSAAQFRTLVVTVLGAIAGATLLSGQPAPAVADSAPLLPRLQGIVVVDDPAAVNSAGRRETGVVPSANPLTRSADFVALLTPWLDRPLDRAGLDGLTRTIVRYFRAHDRPMIDVVVPEQPIDTGTLQLLIVEGRLARIEVEGNRWSDADALSQQIRLAQGDLVDSARLDADLAWLNRNPFRTVQAVLSPGDAWGRTDLVLRTTEERPWRLQADYDNTGNPLTGRDRASARLVRGALFGGEGVVSYQFTTSRDFAGVRAHAVSFQQPLSWRHTVAAYASFVDSRTRFQGFELSGTSAQAGLRYTIPLRAAGRLQHEVSGGFDWKSADNQLEFGVPVSGSKTGIAEFTLGYRFSRPDTAGAFDGDVELRANPAGLVGHQRAADYDGSRAGARPNFAVLRLTLNRVTRLPADLSLSHRAVAQWTQGNLLPSEQLQAGGSQSVRGYEEHATANSDRGWTVQNELRLPFVALARYLPAALAPGRLQGLVFADYGWTAPVTRASGEAGSTTLASVGAGLRCSLGRRVSLRIDYGRALQELGPDRGRWHLGGQLTF